MLAILLLLAPILAAPGSVTSAATTTDPINKDSTVYVFPTDPSPRYANSVPKPTAPAPTYAAAFSDLSSLLPSGIETRTWGNWDPLETETASDTSDPYGDYAWSQLWDAVTLYNITSSTDMYSSVVEPTPIPSSELVLPPEDIVKFDDSLKFPKDFVFGVAGSAAQIEGAIFKEGRSPSVQELLLPNPKTPQDYVTNQNYYLYKQDIARIAAMGVKYYSFNIPWSRILPFSMPGTPVNQAGIAHYEDLINTCLEYGVTPVVTLAHFDTPAAFVNDEFPVSTVARKNNTGSLYPLFNNAGYCNESFVEAFVNYGKIVMTHFADRVPIWVVINEPLLYSAYPIGVKNVINATAQIHKFYHQEIKGTGKVGIKLNNNFAMPKNASDPEDVRAADRAQDFFIGNFLNPMVKGEDYPNSWKDTFTSYNGTIDPNNEFLFTPEQLEEVAGSTDFFGIDPYTISITTAPDGGIEACQANTSHPMWPQCVNQTSIREDGWNIGYRSESYVYITPKQFRDYLNYMWVSFKIPIFVGEFGFPEFKEGEKLLPDQLFDLNRSLYYRTFMEAILEAIHHDGVDVMAAFAWSFADNWEFGDFGAQFGLQVVNRTTQQRYYKKSFFDLVQYIEERS
ncbi:glycoside hydrolase family 1 protein [Suhomyces tanzawaensis NRRL Y-17324]|uniref:Glycoside hydrolase family 1 protein n=1 Tax=Suhomyces tanzawaensis NRRL Y-17324 TaxID=984487 RepID=A0A1E4SBD7_9ASCO|nr:glycoside hydrolase family 1 protein [Suhomyces tanzawaensis NRRL Y-17324]ODV76840.1 glycoside hydrolase family 1 protein [Suhomyces tanzawaensis NRRL Y-17324]